MWTPSPNLGEGAGRRMRVKKIERTWCKGKEYDDIRTDFLESCGYQVLSFRNNQILQGLDLILETIYLTLIRLPAPSPKLGEGVHILAFSHTIEAKR